MLQALDMCSSDPVQQPIFSIVPARKFSTRTSACRTSDLSNYELPFGTFLGAAALVIALLARTLLGS